MKDAYDQLRRAEEEAIRARAELRQFEINMQIIIGGCLIMFVGGLAGLVIIQVMK